MFAAPARGLKPHPFPCVHYCRPQGVFHRNKKAQPAGCARSLRKHYFLVVVAFSSFLPSLAHEHLSETISTFFASRCFTSLSLPSGPLETVPVIFTLWPSCALRSWLDI